MNFPSIYFNNYGNRNTKEKILNILVSCPKKSSINLLALSINSLLRCEGKISLLKKRLEFLYMKMKKTI